jgi:hypothetical protein
MELLRKKEEHKPRKHQQGVFREEFGRHHGGDVKKGTSLKNRIRAIKRLLAKPVTLPIRAQPLISLPPPCRCSGHTVAAVSSFAIAWSL